MTQRELKLDRRDCIEAGMGADGEVGWDCSKEWKKGEVMELMNLAATHQWTRRPVKSPRENETYAISLGYANNSRYSGG